jgi:hypothetical protein
VYIQQVAAAELEKARAGYEEERKRRDNEIRERHQVTLLRRQMKERTELREKMKVCANIISNAYSCIDRGPGSQTRVQM